VFRPGAVFVRERSFYRALLRLALPVVGQSVITIGLHMIDTMMLGVYGESQISGSSLASEYITLYMILCFGITGGGGVLTSQYWGSGDIAALKQTVNVMLRSVLALSVLFSGLAFFAPGWVIHFYSPEEEIIAMGASYLRMCGPAFPLIGITLSLTMVLRTTRRVQVPLFASLFAFVMNIFLNWALIYGKLGFPEMQIRGAALATTITRVFETGIIAGAFLADTRIAFRLRELFMRIPSLTVRAYLRYGSPGIVSDFFVAGGNTIIAMIIGHIGYAFVAAYAIVAQLMRLVTVFNVGLSNAGGVIIGNTIGEGRYDAAYRYGKTLYALGILTGVAAAGALAALSPLLLRFFRIEAATVGIANQLIAALAVMVIFMTTESVMTKGVLRSGGDTRFLMIADVLFLWVAAVPLGYLAGLVLHLDPFYIYICLRIDTLIKAVWCLFRLRSKKWIRRVAVTDEKEPGAPAEG